MITSLTGLQQHAYPFFVGYVLCFRGFLISIIKMTIGDINLKLAIGIRPLPTAASFREVVIILVIHTIVAVAMRRCFPKTGTCAVIIDTLGTNTQINHRFVVGIQVELNLLFVLQIIIQREFKINVVFITIGFIISQLIVHHIGACSYRFVCGAHNQVEIRCIIVIGIGIAAARRISFIRIVGSLPVILIHGEYQFVFTILIHPYRLHTQVVWCGLTFLFPNGMAPTIHIIKRPYVTETQLDVVGIRGGLIVPLEFGIHTIYQHIGYHTRQAVLQRDGDTTYGSSYRGCGGHGGVTLQISIGMLGIFLVKC